ncbi:hypothetical protein GYMLUDRAFT_42212 [Collybiopsis luxurians FD-317 M1]|uniref:Unplaced genomic scaffold GYMLUscaffold_20, whole genome shotgun sequence n=1 Tax=Collybiopsis luxurians FD-317 M1 TaxID=944289 RepID=A0A0D0D017_9AGAR|nr:hypothetical protein GYMLUDRAFT_42212 [Collybiopsis luxurians FD-317 M1]
MRFVLQLSLPVLLVAFLLFYPDEMVIRHAPASFDELATKLFPALASFLDKDENSGWATRPKIQELRGIRIDRLRKSLNDTRMPDAAIDAMLISDDDASTMKTELEASGAPKELLTMWDRYVGAVNHIMKIYGKGEKPRYPDIDTISYKPTSAFWIRFIDQTRGTQLSGDSGTDVPPWDAIYIAARLLNANNREDALRYPDLWTKDNAPAVALARSINWDDLPYAAILIPGEGPERVGVQLSPLAVLKMEMAIKPYLEGKAPFLIVSGGTVHPAHTEFNEAFEMKSWLIEQHGIASDRIIVEPYARHTTTNFRNSGRVLDILGVPKKKHVLVVTDGHQLEFIESDRFRRNEKKELTHKVGKIGPRRGNYAIEFLPSPLCGIVDPMDPMDP